MKNESKFEMINTTKSEQLAFQGSLSHFKMSDYIWHHNRMELSSVYDPKWVKDKQCSGQFGFVRTLWFLYLSHCSNRGTFAITWLLVLSDRGSAWLDLPDTSSFCTCRVEDQLPGCATYNHTPLSFTHLASIARQPISKVTLVPFMGWKIF